MLLLFVVGDVVGGGIYTLVGDDRRGGRRRDLDAVRLRSVLAVLTASSYAELVTKYPQAAGAALYVNKAFRKPFFTFMVAFAVMCSGIASAATLSRGVRGDYLPQLFVGRSPSASWSRSSSCWSSPLVNFRGISESVKLNVVLT